MTLRTKQDGSEELGTNKDLPRPTQEMEARRLTCFLPRLLRDRQGILRKRSTLQ